MDDEHGIGTLAWIAVFIGFLALNAIDTKVREIHEVVVSCEAPDEQT